MPGKGVCELPQTRGRSGDPPRPCEQSSCSIDKDILSWFDNVLLGDMKIIGFLLLLSGWGIVLAAVLMLRGHAASVFILLGAAVEVLGFVFVAKAHLPTNQENG